MKRLILITALLSLNGCAVVDYYRMAKWDNNEYLLVNELRTEAQLGAEHCASRVEVLPYVDYAYRKSVEYRNYASGVARNDESVKMSEELLAITKGLKDRYYSGDEVSQKYCELKFNTIYTSTGTIETAIGAKPR